MDKILSKCTNKVYLLLLKPVALINSPLYTKKIVNHYKKHGMNICGNPYYIHSQVHFDGSDYSLIRLEDGCSISSNVCFLTHDFSANTVYKNLTLKNYEVLESENRKNGLKTLRPIRVGANTFVGMNSLILPGSDIGCNCVIGAGSVVRGKIPDNSIVMGNPAVVVKKTSDWLEAKVFDNND